MSSITWLGHSTFHIQTPEAKILMDPFFQGNPIAQHKPSDFHPDFIVVSHGHGDHIGDTVEIAKRTGATVISNYEISLWLESKGVKTHGMQHGGAFTFPFGKLKLTLAFHGSALPDGSNGGNPCGILIRFKNGFTFYNAADTGLFSDMKLIGEEGIDLAALPIGDNYTMGPEDALRAVKLINPKKVMPMHYNTFPLINQDAKAWAAQVSKETKSEPVMLNIQDTFEF